MEGKCCCCAICSILQQCRHAHSTSRDASMLLLNSMNILTAPTGLWDASMNLNKGMTHLRAKRGQSEAKEVLEGRSSPPLLTAAATGISCGRLALVQQPDVHPTTGTVAADKRQSPGSKKGPRLCRGTRQMWKIS